MLAAIWLLLTACGSREEPLAPETEDWVYVPEFILLEDDYIDYDGMALTGDNLCYLSMKYSESLGRYTQYLENYSLSRRTASSRPLVWPEEPAGLSLNEYVFAEDGSLYAIARAYPTEPPAPGSSSGPRTFLCGFGPEGDCLWSMDITEDLQDGSPQQPYISQIRVDQHKRLYLMDNSHVWLYDQNGTFCGRLSSDAPGSRMNGLYLSGDGRMCLCIQTQGMDGGSHTLYEIDFAGKGLTQLCTDFPGGNAFAPGIRSAFLMQDRNGIYTYDYAEKKADLILRWMDCDISGNDVLYFRESDDDSIVAVMQNQERKGEIALLTRTDADKAAQKENLTLAVLSDAYIYEPEVVKFNRSSDQYHITIREYMDYQQVGSNSRADALARLYADLASDNCPDLMELTGLDVAQLAGKNVFQDLHPFLEKSALLDQTDFMEEILDAYTFDGVLTSIPSLFFLETVMGHSGQLGAEPGWTLDELMTLAETNPEAELFDGALKNDILNYILLYSQDAFIDWSAGSCSFDSPEFQSLLEFADSFPGETAPDPDRPGTPALIQSGQVLLKNTYLYDFDSIQMDMAMFGDDAVCIGFPTPDGSPRHGLTTAYAYAITSKSHGQEGAWAFLEYVLTEKENSKNQMGFPTLKRRLEAMMAEALQEEYILDENGDPYLDENGNPIITGTQTTSGNGWSYTYHTATKQEADMILSLLAGASLTPPPGSDSQEIMSIVREEANAFFAGQKSLSETAAVIQSRAALYISVNR